MRRRFVGRREELAVLESGFASAPENALFRVTGGVGTGKTALLVELLACCAERKIPCRSLHPDESEVTVDAVRAALAELDAEAENVSYVPESLAANDVRRARAVNDVVQAPEMAARRVLVVDDVHRLPEVEKFLAFRAFSARSALTIVLADRRASSAVWLDGRAALVREVPLAPLRPEEVAELFERAGIAEPRRSDVALVAEGNPLLLVALCEAVEDDSSALLRLGGGFFDAVPPEPDHRFAFALAVASRGTTYELLEAGLGDAVRAGTVFRWLRSLTLLEETRAGLQPYPVVRRACAVYLKTHHRALFAEAMARARGFEDAQPPRSAPQSSRRAEVPRPADVTPDLLSGDAPTDLQFRELLQQRLGALAAQSRLTEREHEVFELLVLGRNSAEIGTVLGITARTAKFHQQRVLEKIGADTRQDILRLLLV